MIKRKKKTRIIFFVAMTLIFTLCMIVLHEVAHTEIDNIYNCENIHYTVSLTEVRTIGDCDTNLEGYRLAHSINEIIHYGFAVPLIIICSIMFTRFALEQ